MIRNGASRQRWGRVLLLSALAFPLALPLGLPDAAAQERRTLMDLFFGNRRQVQERSIINLNTQPQRRRQPARVTAPRPERAPVPMAGAADATAVTAPPAVQKMENARKILVIGDFTAMGLGKGLTAAFADDPSVSILEQGSGSSGLVREDHLDWPKELERLIAAEKPKLVVVMIGANDRQTMQMAGGRERFRTDRWFGEYEARVTKLVTLATAQKLPVLWVGLPPFESPSLTADAVTLNSIYQKQVEAAGGEFVDIWDGFVSEGGQFIVSGSDINGQPVRLRAQDGIGFTDAGKRKLAFYVEKLARRHLGDLSVTDLIRLDAGDLPLLSSLPPQAETPVKTQPISLSDPSLDGGETLMGASRPLPAAADSPRDLLVTKGELKEAPIGRVDYYRMDVTGATR
nr:DUF459 domain-containing protein [Neorhizobium galegae]